MNDIKIKVEELWEMIKVIPDDIKGPGDEKTKGRMKYLKVRRHILELLNILENDNI